MTTWQIVSPVPVPRALADAVGGHPLIAQTLVRRGITDPAAAHAFLNPDAYTPALPEDLPDMVRAVERVAEAIQRQQTILVWGDFDVDGQTATALLVDGLRGLGAQVRYYIPQRETEGHGVHVGKLGQLLDDGAALIVTCDTGITAHEAVDYAAARGVDTVITDHHQLPVELPPAYAVVNSQRLAVGHPLYTLPGVGCAYKLVEALYTRAGRADQTARLLDLVALGIVADVVVQTGDARYLLQRGLDVLRSTTRLGLVELMQRADINPELVDEETIGFSLAPMLNAVGRLADANTGVEFLTSGDPETAITLANRLIALNEQRKSQTEQVYAAALQQIEADPRLLDFPALVVGREGWPGGIVGIVANRLVERFDRPVVLFSVEPGAQARGSARSVPGCDITAAIQQVDAELPGMIIGYGGHTMAAGLSLPDDRLQEFRRALGRVVAAQLGDTPPGAALRVDGEVDLNELSLELVDDLRRLAPFGPGNPPLTLAARKLTLADQKRLGRDGRHLRLTVQDEGGTTREVLWWRADPEALPPGRFDLAFTPGVNVWQGKRSLQLTLVDLQPVDEAPLTFSHRGMLPVEDFRALSDGAQLAELIRLAGDDDLLVWGEGDSLADVPQESLVFELVQRDNLRRARTLAVWTAPPSLMVLQAALQAVNPDRLILFSRRPGTDAINAFLERLSGVVTHVLKSERYAGQVTLHRLAGTLGHTEAAAHAGLDWLQARGHIDLTLDEDGLCRIEPANGGREKDPVQVKSTNQRIAALLQEAKSFRAYYRTADSATLTGL
ncbi:MAG: single-stranded-DNA-specific exonuclease RecJ [Chloroflexota bacterium]